MLKGMLEKIIVYTPEAMAEGSMWWWVIPLAPGVPEILMVGKEREFLNWFYQGPHVVKREAISPESVNEYPWPAIGQLRAHKVSMERALADGSSCRARRLLADRWRSVSMFNRVILAWEYPSEHHASAPGYHVLPAVKLIGDGGSLHRGSCSRVP